MRHSVAAGLVGTTIAAGVAASYVLQAQPDQDIDVDAITSEPGLLKRHSSQQEFVVDGIKFPSIRIFFHPHPQADKLPTTPTCLPLLVFIHGLGGSVAQFNGLLTNLVNVAPCLAIDLPGCGRSEFAPTDWSAYALEHYVNLITAAIDRNLDKDHNQKVVLIGHSLGCSLATLLATGATPQSAALRDQVIGLIALCPRTSPLSDKEKRQINLASYLPVPVFDLLRVLDRRGGLDSKSVTRFVGKHADNETKLWQLRFNEQSRSPVFLRFLTSLATSKLSLPGPETWTRLDVPLACIGGEDDHICPPENLKRINEAFQQSRGELDRRSIVHDELESVTRLATIPVVATITTPDANADYVKPPFCLRTATLPSPAGHSLLFASTTVRLVSGLIQRFVSSHIDGRLSIGWQLQHLTTEGKWDVKNLEKWKRVNAVSGPIAGVFRAMKTLREVDGAHTPKVFSQNWGINSGVDQPVAAIVDVSHDSPVYDPKGLEVGGIEYHKFPTVSKLPPTTDEVRGFIALVDRLRAHIAANEATRNALIAVHCHYGFNRTGFFQISYMVERLGYRLQDALDEFARQRPPGVRHQHFVNEMFVRYASGLRRQSTWN